MKLTGLADGNWVAYNYKCKQCGHNMPLPKMAGKYCSICGNKMPSLEEFRAEVAKHIKHQVIRVCYHCKEINRISNNFCLECGKSLEY